MNDANKFLEILNKQHQNIKYTIEFESEENSLNFLDLNFKNNKTGKYQFKIHRKNAITNVQIKPTSNHDPKIINGIFKGFVNRAFVLCSPELIEQELEFLINIFVENGYNKNQLHHTIKTVRSKFTDPTPTTTNNTDSNKKYISLPWIPGLSPKLKKVFRTAGYQPVFKSGKNLKDILSAKNKPKLPPNSYPGVYKIDCDCGKTYIGETRKQISTRLKEHKKCIDNQKWEQSAVADHCHNCDKNINWENNTKTLSIENNNFQRKVREALEIQYHETAPNFNNGMNQDDGKYVTTRFWKPFFSYLKNANGKRENNVALVTSREHATL